MKRIQKPKTNRFEMLMRMKPFRDPDERRGVQEAGF